MWGSEKKVNYQQFAQDIHQVLSGSGPSEEMTVQWDET